MEKFKAFVASTLGRIVVTIVSAVVIFTLMMLLMSSGSTLFVFLFAACFIYFGWKALNFITPRIFLIMPLAGWFFYICIKGFIACFIGIFVAPFQIGLMISRAVGNSVAEK